MSQPDRTLTILRTAVSAVDETLHPTLVLISGADAGMNVRLSLGWVVIGRDESADITVRSHTMSRRHAQFFIRANGQVLLHDLESTNGTLVNGSPLGAVPVALNDGDRLELGDVKLRFVRQFEEVQELQAELYEAAVCDSLTHAFNKRHFADCLVVECSRAGRAGSPLTLLLVDLDHFKGVNDRYGHLAGDAVLAATAALLMSVLRKGDLLARWGGEEFAVILPDTSADAALVVAERLRAAVESTPVFVDGSCITVTISIGLATGPVPGDVSGNALLERADKWLYEAKSSGRNRVGRQTLG